MTHSKENKVKLHEKQKQIVQDISRFKVVRAGRKGGKTTLAVEMLAYEAIKDNKNYPNRSLIYIAPTQQQARRIIWQALKSRLHGIGKFSESQMTITIPNQSGGVSHIYVGGWENRENYRGMAGVVFIVFDEVDTLRDFFLAWREIFRPIFIDTAGSAMLIGTPKKENPNIRRLEEEYKDDPNWGFFHFTSQDNPFLPKNELNEMKNEYIDNFEAYRQEVLAEHVESSGALFKREAIYSIFKQSAKEGEKYMTVDISGDGKDLTLVSIWNGLNLIEIIKLTSQGDTLAYDIKDIINTKEIPIQNVAIDAIGEGSHIAKHSALTGSVAYKGSLSAIKTEEDITKPANKRNSLKSEYKNLRSQCVFMLANKVNNHQIAIKGASSEAKEKIIQELELYQDVSKGDGKLQVTTKDKMKEFLNRSPDYSDLLVMRMYFDIISKVDYTRSISQVKEPKINEFFTMRRANQRLNDTI